MEMGKQFEINRRINYYNYATGCNNLSIVAFENILPNFRANGTKRWSGEKKRNRTRERER